MGITNVGMAHVAKALGTDTEAGTAVYDYVAIGEGTTAAAAADKDLESETQRAAGTGTNVTTSVTDDTLQIVKDAFTFGGGAEAITEAGLVNEATEGELLCRSVFSVVNCGTSDTLKVTIKVQIKQGS